MMRILAALGFLAAIAGHAGMADAQPSPAQTDAIRHNCRADYQSLCSAVPPGGQASLNCLAQNQARLSPACGHAVAAVAGGGAAAGAPAAASPAPSSAPSAAPAPFTAQTRTAPTVPPHGPLSPPPQMSPREELSLMRGACGMDYRRLCAGVPLGGGNALRCLANHSQSLSSRCDQALMMMHARR